MIRWKLKCQSNVSTDRPISWTSSWPKFYESWASLWRMAMKTYLKLIHHHLHRSTFIYENSIKYESPGSEELIFICASRSPSEIKVCYKTGKRTLHCSHTRSVWYWVKRSRNIHYGIMITFKSRPLAGRDKSENGKRERKDLNLKCGAWLRNRSPMLGALFSPIFRRKQIKII